MLPFLRAVRYLETTCSKQNCCCPVMHDKQNFHRTCVGIKCSCNVFCSGNLIACRLRSEHCCEQRDWCATFVAPALAPEWEDDGSVQPPRDVSTSTVWSLNCPSTNLQRFQRIKWVFFSASCWQSFFRILLVFHNKTSTFRP